MNKQNQCTDCNCQDNEEIKDEGYWAAMGTDPKTGQPIKTTEWIDRLAPKALAVVGAGTCATYGGIHAMAGNPSTKKAMNTVCSDTNRHSTQW